MTQPDDTRIRLLTAMGWKNCNSTYGYNKGGFCVLLLPELDANLLAAARAQLLTTEEEWEEYFHNLIAHCESNCQSNPYFSIAEMTEMEKLPLDIRARAILAVKEGK